MIQLRSKSGKEVKWGVNKFPDLQQQFWCDEGYAEPLELWVSIESPEELDIFLQIIYNPTLMIQKLRINYLYGARSDKDFAGDRCVTNVARMLGLFLDGSAANYLHDCDIELLSPHCLEEISQSWPEQTTSGFPVHSEIVNNTIGYDCIVFPDRSAFDRFEYTFDWQTQWHGVNLVVCDKKREQVSGNVIEHVVPDLTGYKRVLVVDDLCDGGRTFIDVAEKVRKGDVARCDPSITHGVFSNNAVERLLKVFDNIYVSNSLRSANIASQFVHVMDVWS